MAKEDIERLQIDLDGLLEVLSELFDTRDFTIVYGKDFEYNQEAKTIYVGENYDYIMSAMGIAHEFMHHVKNIEGRAIKGLDMEDYKQLKLLSLIDDKFLWPHKNVPQEIEANAFCKLFIDRYLKFLHGNKIISTHKFRAGQKQAVDILGIDPNEFYGEEKVKELLDKEAATYKELDARYGNDIEFILTNSLSSAMLNLPSSKSSFRYSAFCFLLSEFVKTVSASQYFLRIN